MRRSVARLKALTRGRDIIEMVTDVHKSFVLSDLDDDCYMRRGVLTERNDLPHNPLVFGVHGKALLIALRRNDRQGVLRMRQNRLTLVWTLLFASAGGLCATGMARAQSPSAVKSREREAPQKDASLRSDTQTQIDDAARDEQTESKVPHERIKIHGHWTIDVRDAGGKLVTHREFENALAFDGPLNLATALGRTATPGRWRIEIDFANYPSGPCFFNNSPIYCLIHESGDTNVPGSGSNDFYNLTVSAPIDTTLNNFTGAFSLNGSFTVQNAGAIAGVATALGACAPSVPPANCTLGPAFNSYQVLGFSAFSAATVAPINVAVGQLVRVSVVFSFA